MHMEGKLMQHEHMKDSPLLSLRKELLSSHCAMQAQLQKVQNFKSFNIKKIKLFLCWNLHLGEVNQLISRNKFCWRTWWIQTLETSNLYRMKALQFHSVVSTHFQEKSMSGVSCERSTPIGLVTRYDAFNIFCDSCETVGRVIYISLFLSDIWESGLPLKSFN